MKTIKKPKPKIRRSLDWTECTAFIEKKYQCQTRDFANSHAQYGEWCQSVGEKVQSSSQAQWKRYQAAIAKGDVVERPYQDFWHFICDTLNPSNGGTITLSADLGDGAEEWQKTILGYYLTEFGEGPYLNEW